MNFSHLPTLNASLNAVSAILLLAGFFAIKKGHKKLHQKIMIVALISSAIFLTCYLVYHYQVGSVPYPDHDWTRPVYFVILIPHVILAIVMTPFIILAVKHAMCGNFAKHKRIVRWVWPVWMFVSVTGVIVYMMLYL